MARRLKILKKLMNQGGLLALDVFCFQSRFEFPSWSGVRVLLSRSMFSITSAALAFARYRVFEVTRLSSSFQLINNTELV